MKMKRIIFFLLVSVAGISASAQVTIPFDVPTPTWEMLVAPKDEDNPPIAFEKPNASSNVLVSQCGEDCNYQWASRSAIPEWWDIVTLYGHYPLISQDDNRWACLEFYTGYDAIPVYVPSQSLRKVPTYRLTEQDVINSTAMLAWRIGDELYVVTNGGCGPGYATYNIGKFKDGFVVFPYSCILDLDYTSSFPGILNGTVSDNFGLDKFTRKDVDYLLSHATEDYSMIVYGYKEPDGSKNYGNINTSLVHSSTSKSVAEDNEIYTSVDTEPSFAGGLPGIMRFLAQNIKYPQIAQEKNTQGKVLVSFVVEKDGSISDVTVTKSVDPALDKEAVRVVKTLPKFTSAGKINGRPVRTKMSLPVTFKLN